MTKARTLADNFAADINAVTANAPLTGGGTSGTVTVGIQAGTTAQSGAVQLTDSTASTSTTTAATPNSVKSAFDLANTANSAASSAQTTANAAIAKSTIDAKGDLLVGTANDTVSRLAVASTAGFVLTVDSAEATGLKWAAAASGSSFSGCSLYGTDPGNFEISAGASTLITWNQELFDVGGYHSTSSNTDRITIPSGKAGYYLINAAIQWDDDNAVATCGIRVYLNGTEIARRYFLRSDNGGRTATDVQVTRNLAVNDYLQVYAYTETAQGAYHYSPDARFEVIFVGNA